MRRKPATHLDPHGDFVFGTRLLGRQPGSMRAETRIVTAPGHLRLELVGVPAGTEIELDVRLEAVTEGVLVSGSATAPLAGECARCLEPLTSSVEVSFQELYRYEPALTGRSQPAAGRNQSGPAGLESSWEDDEDEYFLDGDLLDLEPVFRDAVVLALPLAPLCSANCLGLCVECGVRLADAGTEHEHGGSVDPKWAALRQFDGFDRQDETDRRASAGDRQEG
jgi:DUF177 domain-containing protein